MRTRWALLKNRGQVGKRGGFRLPRLAGSVEVFAVYSPVKVVRSWPVWRMD